MVPSEGLLTTGQVARLLGCSRQHVVDLCERGVLRSISVGSHRRIRSEDVAAMSGENLTRDQERSLWLHRAVAGRLATDPQRVLQRAEANLRQLEDIHPRGMTAAWLRQWRTILDSGVDTVFDALTSRVPRAVELRQNSPFAGVLDEKERQAVLASFADHWRQEHVA